MLVVLIIIVIFAPETKCRAWRCPTTWLQKNLIAESGTFEQKLKSKFKT